MNAPASPLSRAERQALEAPLLIEDQDVVLTIARLADARGEPMREIVRSAIEDYLRRFQLTPAGPESLQRFWAEHPLPLPSGLKADKRFYDSLNDEL